MIKIAVCDDNREELNKISHTLDIYRNEKNPYITTQLYGNGFSLIDALESGINFDIVILDIIMPGENGIDIAREIRKSHEDIQIIFLTSSPEYAVESYEVNANNYILKPFSEEKIFSVMDTCLKHIDSSHTASLVLKTGSNQYMRILYSKLMYAEAMRKTVVLHLSDNTVVSSVMTFTNFITLLDDNPDFVKTHRSYIVNMNYIELINKTEIIMINGDRIPVPPKKYSEVSKTFFDFAFNNSFGNGGH